MSGLGAAGGDETEWRLEPEMRVDGHRKCRSEPETSLKALNPPACTCKHIRFVLMMPLIKNITLSHASAGVSAVGVAMVASAAKSLLIKTCSDKNTHNAKVRGIRGG